MKWWPFLILSLLTGIGSLRGEADFEGLTSTNFKVREEAQGTFLEWIFNDPVVAREEVLQVYLSTDDPELRMRLVPVLERAYFPPKGYVGIMMQPAFLDALGRAPGDFTKGQGILVTRVVPGTPAELSGLRERDVIVQMDEWVVEGGVDLNSLFADRIQANPPGRKIKLKVQRGEEEVEVALQLGILPTPSQRARDARELQKDERLAIRNLLPTNLQDEMAEFGFWLGDEIEKHGKTHR
ncbi:MAG: PDZ domain-containing protein [Akkermansiaceae bacterium]|jgi:membrane-associated protease RseP (regulator of RpoE activity)